MRRLWTEKERKILKKMAAAGNTAQEIMLVLKSRTRESIYNQAQALNINFNGPSPEIDEEIYEQFMGEVIDA